MLIDLNWHFLCTCVFRHTKRVLFKRFQSKNNDHEKRHFDRASVILKFKLVGDELTHIVEMNINIYML